MPRKILVVDDESDIVIQLKIRLEAAGYEVVTAYNGEDAISQVRKESPDLILLDIMMPPPNGFQVCRILKDDNAYSHIPIIMLTAKSAESDKFWGTESGADDYVTKPYNAEELMGKVKAFLDNK